MDVFFDFTLEDCLPWFCPRGYCLCEVCADCLYKSECAYFGYESLVGGGEGVGEGG